MHLFRIEEQFSTDEDQPVAHEGIVSQLKRAQQQAQAASQAKVQFLALMSHELRTPLTGIISTASMMLEQDTNALNPEEVREFAQIIAQSGAYLLSTIDNILNFTKLETNKLEVVPAPFCLNEIVDDIVHLMQPSAQEKRIRLSVHYYPNLPPVLINDGLIMRHIITNLVSNAIKYTEHGSIKISVQTIKQTAYEAKIIISVADTGTGIENEKLDYIFDSFTQVENSYVRKSSRLGIGLGLAIVKKLVELLNGRVYVQSTVGRGSTFKIIFKTPIVSQQRVANLKAE